MSASFSVLFFALCSLSLATAAPTAPRLRGLTAAVSGNWQDELLAAVNAERAKAGLSKLCSSSKLVAAAQKHSEDMAKNNYMDHKGTGGSTMTTRINAERFHWTSLGENVAAGQASVADVMTSWMGSPGHRANILGDFKYFGAGMAQNPHSKYTFYWTQNFAASSSEPCACLV